ncbi:hypothetical protein P175DRAFT_0516959 [Aspergillus ochraceoroseus IBT 24754]|uniref:Uncharacterized protein n=1 Tax=Aspergillus ochraceoroseus IBT 24754 TaxID=1392256 RepID=A0A2T5LUG0_9EURO|nr:uncharacterized protein P175DRAFT_0516959 [Aspergillus ochraceoroseus IBT 24754]PTU19910.1 hypothetical protein P175DRAFT_0516959 [Aspergillus ochraceoroseus IBT 24754]
MTARLSPLLRDSVVKHPESVGLAIDIVWPEAGTIQRYYTKWRLLQFPYENWITSTTPATEYSLPQGHLIIDGRIIGKLPADVRDSEILKEIFGSQRLFAFPSNLPGMDYTLANHGEGHQARTSNSILELIPRHVFGNGPEFDLPFSLISDCIHWIYIRTGILEARRKPHIWKTRGGNWIVDIHSRRAQRRQSILVDPFSRLARSISQIFLHFEYSCRLTIFQPPRGKLSVELKQLDLDFFVNDKGLLQCRQLGSVVDPNQDPGTLYGLQSMMVLRDVWDRSQRSIIIPLGQVFAKRHHNHVLVSQLHAFTSYFLPDPLTNRTGIEEALACLQSGYCQPWTPLATDLVTILTSILNLTPRREYYPKDKQCQQIISWDPQLTTCIQHDAFQLIVTNIINKSQRLS